MNTRMCPSGLVLAALLSGCAASSTAGDDDSPDSMADAGPGDTDRPDAGVYATATERVSVSSAEVESSMPSYLYYAVTISHDGRYAAFDAFGPDLVDGDTNNVSDVFVRDRKTGDTVRASVASDGSEANARSVVQSLSGDGQRVLFWSAADNLVAGDTNASADYFVRDLAAGTTTRVSVASDGTQQTLTGPGGSVAWGGAISGDGRVVMFASSALELAPWVPDPPSGGNDDNHVYVHFLDTGETRRVTVNSAGERANGDSFPGSLSADGRFAAFESDATNRVDGDSNGVRDIFVHDLDTGATTRVSLADGGGQSSGSPENVVPGGSSTGVLSADGRFVMFNSFETNLVAGDSNLLDDVFVHDRDTGATVRVNVSSAGAQTTEGFDVWEDGSFYEGSHGLGISADGRYVSFESFSSELAEGDTNAAWDVFVRDLKDGVTERVSLSWDHLQANDDSHLGQISGDGRYVAFQSDATNLVEDDGNLVTDVFVAPNPVAPGDVE